MRAGDLKDTVNVMRPTEAKTAGGQPQGKDRVIRSEVHCFIDPVSGSEAEIARQQTGVAAFAVQMYGDPAARIERNDYLTGCDLGSRVLFISYVNDVHRNHSKLVLTCGENPK
jgi:hypothetical protein